jgi:hypothetical protein
LIEDHLGQLDHQMAQLLEEAKKVRARKMIRELRSLGYRVELLTSPAGNPA